MKHKQPKPRVEFLEALISFSWLTAWAYAALLATLLVLAMCAPVQAQVTDAPVVHADLKKVSETERWSLTTGRYCNVWYFRHPDKYQPWWRGSAAVDVPALGVELSTAAILAARASDWPKLIMLRTHNISDPLLAPALAPCISDLPPAPPGPWLSTPSASTALDAPMYTVSASGARLATALPGARALRNLQCACEKLVVAPTTAGGSTYCAVRSLMPQYPRAVTRCTEVKP